MPPDEPFPPAETVLPAPEQPPDENLPSAPMDEPSPEVMPQKSHLRRVVGGTFFYGLGQSLPKVVRFLLLPVFTKILTPSDYGVLELATNFGAFLQTFMRMGVPSAVTRYYYDYRDGPALRDYATTVAWFLLVCSLIIGGLALAIFPWVGGTLIPGMPLLPFAILAVVSGVMYTNLELQNRLVQAREQASYMARLNIGRASISILLAVVFVVIFRWGAAGMLSAEVASFSVLALVAARYLRFDLAGRFRWPMLRASLQYGLAMLPGDFVAALAPLATRAILSGVKSTEATGILAVANKFILPLTIIAYAFQTAYVPIYFAARKEGTEEALLPLAATARNVWAGAIAAALGIRTLGPPTIMLMTPDSYHTAIPLVPILVVSFLGLVMYSMSSSEVYYSKQTWWIPLIAYGGAAVEVGITVLTVERHGAAGVAWAASARWLFWALAFGLLSRRFVKVPYPWFSLIRITLCGAAVYVASLLLPPIAGWREWFVGCGGLAAFAALLWITGDPSLREGVKLAAAIEEMAAFAGMNSCIYYDVEEISSADVRRARAVAPGTMEFIARGAIWPTDVTGAAPAEVPNARDFGYQEELMAWVNRLFQNLERLPDAGSFALRHGASLLEIARYGFFFEFTVVEQRARALAEIRRRMAPNRIVWVAPAARHRQLRELADGDTDLRFELVSSRAPKKMISRFWRSSKNRIRPWFDRLADRWDRTAGRASANAMPRTLPADTEIVFSEFFPNSAKVLLPVARWLRESHGINVYWLSARESVRDMLREKGVASRLLREVAGASRVSAGHLPAETRRRLAEALDELPEECFAGTGGVVKRAYLQPAIERQLGDALDDAAYWLDAYRTALDRLQPRCVVSTSYLGVVGRAGAIAAREHGARAVYVQHGAFPEGRFYRHFCHDLLLIWGDDNRRSLIECGIEPERIQVVGAAIYDELARSREASDHRPFPQPGRPIEIAYMASRTAGTAVSYPAAKLCLTVVARAIEQIPDARLTVKIHPHDRTGMIEGMIPSLPKCEISRGSTSQEVIRQSDIVIVVSSTTGLEACIAGKPLIVLRLPGVSEFITYDKYGAALEVPVEGPESAASIARAIGSMAAGQPTLALLAEGRRRMVDEMLNGGNGDAAELTARAIAALVQHPVKAEGALRAVD